MSAELSSTTAKRTYRDSIFRAFFREPENFLPLAEAVTGKSFSAADARENTITDILLNHPRNDVSFIIGGQILVFMEHQSTVNQNMPLRCLIYVVEVLKNLVPRDLIYRIDRVPLPAPRFFVMYNGRSSVPEHQVLRLTDAMPTEPSGLDLTVELYNVRYDEGKSLLQNCRPMHDYSYFIDRVERGTDSGQDLAGAVAAAVSHCIDRGVMKNFLRAHEWEVFDMLNLIWNEDDARESYIRQGEARGRAEGRAEGKAEGKAEGIAEGEARGETKMASAIRHLMNGMSITMHEAMEALGIPDSERAKYAHLIG